MFRHSRVAAAVCALAFVAVTSPSGSASKRAAIPAIRSTAWEETVLHTFSDSPGDGSAPTSELIADNTGALYGTTQLGGPHQMGTVFKLVPSQRGYAETIIYAFHGLRDGGKPAAGLIEDSAGALYGTTQFGGVGFHRSECSSVGCGVVFKLAPTSTGYRQSVLWALRGGHDGVRPLGTLTMDSSGSLYGTTQYGGSSYAGTAFKLTLAGTSYKESVIYTFTGGADGAQPFAGLVQDGTGALYGTTPEGGVGICISIGCGTVFALTPSKGGYKQSVLYAFHGGSDGGLPTASLLFRNGSLYGTAQYGGVMNSVCPAGCGVAFRLTRSHGAYAETVLHAFHGGTDGAIPAAPLILGNGGTLYGTTSTNPAGCSMAPCGTVFSLAPAGEHYTERVLYTFANRAQGAVPGAGLLEERGALYGTTTEGGHTNLCNGYGCGVVFKLTP